MAILWRSDLLEVIVTHLDTNWQWIKVYVKHLHYSFSVINVYGPNNNAKKRILMQTIATKLQDLDNEVAILGGYFNAILNSKDKKGGKGWSLESQRDFSNFVNDSGLVEILFKKGEFTWTNTREVFFNIAEKLDRFFAAGNWMEANWSCSIEILPFQGSYHFPIFLRIQDEKTLDRCPFKFEAIWLKT